MSGKKVPKKGKQIMTKDEFHSWRRDLGATMEEIADELGVSVRTVGRWESGETEIPRSVAFACAAIWRQLGPFDCDPNIKGLFARKLVRK